MATPRRVPSLNLFERMTPRYEGDEAGFSIKESTGRSGGKGTYASHANAESIVDNTADIARFRNSNADRLAGRGAYLGGWGYGGDRYLDVSRRFIGRNRASRARMFGQRNDQIGLYDTEAGELPTFTPPGGGLGKGPEGMAYSENIAMARRAQRQGRQAGSMEEIRAHATELADRVWEAEQIVKQRR